MAVRASGASGAPVNILPASMNTLASRTRALRRKDSTTASPLGSASTKRLAFVRIRATKGIRPPRGRGVRAPYGGLQAWCASGGRGDGALDDFPALRPDPELAPASSLVH